MQINHDMEHTVGAGIGATLGILKGIFATKFLFLAGIITSPFVETALLAFIGGALGYIGTTLCKWIHEMIKSALKPKELPKT